MINRMKPLAIIQVENGQGRVMLDPFQLVHGIEQHLNRYLAELRDAKNRDLRRNFEAAYRWPSPPASWAGAVPNFE